MAGRTRRVQRSERSWARSLAEVVAFNVRGYRALRELSQSGLAERMTIYGYRWTTATVSEIERVTRNVTLDELLCLSMSLGVTISDLLDPSGIDGRQTDALDYVGPDGADELSPFPVGLARKVLRGEVGVIPVYKRGPDASPADFEPGYYDVIVPSGNAELEQEARDEVATIGKVPLGLREALERVEARRKKTTAKKTTAKKTGQRKPSTARRKKT